MSFAPGTAITLYYQADRYLGQEQKFRELLAQAKPEQPQWTSLKQPTQQELAKLENEAAKGESTQALIDYQTAYLARSYPELFTKTGPRFLIGDAYAPQFLPQVAAQTGNRSRLADVIQAVNDIKAKRSNGAYTASADVIILDSGICGDCKIRHSASPGCKMPISPDLLRVTQIAELFNSSHEVNHLLSHKLGIYAGLVATGGEKWVEHAKENKANTYGALRTVKMLGLEGAMALPFLKSTFSINLLPGTVDATHQSSRSIQSVMDFLHFTSEGMPGDKTPSMIEQIKSMDDRELLDLSTKLSRPVDPKFYTGYLIPLAEAYATDDVNVLRARKEKLLAEWSKAPNWDAAFAQIRDIWTPGYNDPNKTQMNALAKLNPYRPAALSGGFNTINYANPEQRDAMLTYALERRPEQCADALKEHVKIRSDLDTFQQMLEEQRDKDLKNPQTPRAAPSP